MKFVSAILMAVAVAFAGDVKDKVAPEKSTVKTEAGLTIDLSDVASAVGVGESTVGVTDDGEIKESESKAHAKKSFSVVDEVVPAHQIVVPPDTLRDTTGEVLSIRPGYTVDEPERVKTEFSGGKDNFKFALGNGGRLSIIARAKLCDTCPTERIADIDIDASNLAEGTARGYSITVTPTTLTSETAKGWNE